MKIVFTQICGLFTSEIILPFKNRLQKYTVLRKNVKIGFLTGSRTILGSLALSEPDVLFGHLESYIINELYHE